MRSYLKKPLTALVSTLALLAACAPHDRYQDESRDDEASVHGDPSLQNLAQVTPAQAQAAALTARPGDVVEWELEREAGGSGLRYSFVIRQPVGDFEVGVDAADGGILENTPEGPHPD